MESQSVNGPTRDLALELSVFLLVTFLMSAFWTNDLLLTALLILLFVTAKTQWQSRKYDLPIYAFGVFLAPLVDISNIPAGVWKYGTPPMFLNIPLWLPFAYGVGLLAVVRLADTTYQRLFAGPAS